MKKIFFIAIIIFVGFGAYSQNELDAFRFSETFYSGTARSMAMGGAFGALGADLSTASTNPAGIGVFKHSNLSFSPSVLMTNVDAKFNGTLATNDKLSMMFNNAGFTFGIKNKDNTLKAVNFAVGYNRYNNFAQNYSISGTNDKGSMLDAFMLDANGNSVDNLDNFSTYRAWDTYLLDLVDTMPGTTDYINPLWWYGTPKYGQTVSKTGQVKGGAGETFFTSSVNINNFLYLGATIGLQTFNYNSMTTYSEQYTNDNDTILKSFSYTEYLNDNGTGVNFKAGFLLRPFDFVRLGGAFHSPTYFDIDDKYSTSMESNWVKPDNNGNLDYQSSTDENYYNFHLLTPMRLLGNLGFIVGNFGLISFDYEYADYSSMRLSANDYMFTDENQNIRDQFQATNNFKAGAELRLGMVSLRGGYAYFGNPYKNASYEKTQITGGIGFSSQNIYIDFAYIHDVQKYNVYLYDGYKDEPVPEVTNTRGIINVTMGLKF